MQVHPDEVPANIRTISLAPTTTSHLQPCDQGIIATLKAYIQQDVKSFALGKQLI